MNRSFVLHAVQDVAFEDRPVPPLHDPWDVRIHVGQTGICGSDVHYWQRGRIGGVSLLPAIRPANVSQISYSNPR